MTNMIIEKLIMIPVETPRFTTTNSILIVSSYFMCSSQFWDAYVLLQWSMVPTRWLHYQLIMINNYENCKCQWENIWFWNWKRNRTQIQNAHDENFCIYSYEKQMYQNINFETNSRSCPHLTTQLSDDRAINSGLSTVHAYMLTFWA